MDTMTATALLIGVPCLILIGLYVSLGSKAEPVEEEPEEVDPLLELFPQTVEKYWYCGEWYTYRREIHDKDDGSEYRSDHMKWPINGKILFDPFTTGLVGGAREDFRLIDGLIPATRVGSLIGLYEITEHHPPRSRFYDGLSWDNGCKVDLKFVRYIEGEPMSNDECREQLKKEDN